MHKILWGILILASSLMAQMQNVWVTPQFVTQGIKIIDIRTPGEWKETGIVNGSHTIMFFDENGRFDIPTFINTLDKIVKKDEQFALICRTGSRTSEVSKFLSDKLGYNVINLMGGIVKLQSEGYHLAPYKE
ncbi:MAG: rhodanese-like domain-containing protein [Campylobacterales bacterium]|nr:rhodanese-like domain-containing protein [Campylobacterales bacterium]